jgi:hypothetical protein
MCGIWVNFWRKMQGAIQITAADGAGSKWGKHLVPDSASQNYIMRRPKNESRKFSSNNLVGDRCASMVGKGGPPGSDRSTYGLDVCKSYEIRLAPKDIAFHFYSRFFVLSFAYLASSQ